MSDPSSVPSTYLRFLPALYGTPQNLNAHPFIGQYLKIFEKLLSGIDDAAFLENKDVGHPAIAPDIAERKGIRELLAERVAGNLFYPRLSFLFDASDQDFMPPLSGAKDDDKTKLFAALGSYIGIDVDPHAHTPTAEVEAWLSDFLEWLGRTIALRVDKSWTIDKKRNVIAQMLALYRMRGTVQGMQLLLDLWLDLPLNLTGGTKANSPSRTLTVAVTNPTPPPVRIDNNDPPNSFRLYSSYRPGMPIVSSIVSEQLVGDPSKDNEKAALSAYAPWLFEVDVKVSPGDGIFILKDDDEFAKIFAACREVKHVLDEATPAATHYAIRVMPAVQLGYGAWYSSYGQLANLGLEQHDMSDKNCTIRPKYSNGMLLSAQTLTMEQDYVKNRAALQNKALYTKGIIDGLEVKKKSDTEVTVDAGCAFDADGNLLVWTDSAHTHALSDAKVTLRYVCLKMPDSDTSQNDTVDDTAQVTIVESVTLVVGVSIATIVLDGSGKISNISRGDFAKSRMQVVPATDVMTPKPDSKTSAIQREDQVQVSAETLLESDGTYSVPVYFDETRTAVFSAPPRVLATVVGPTPLALSVDDVRTDGFRLNVAAAVSAIDVSSEPFVIEWLAVC
jgi:hypothetical protein